MKIPTSNILPLHLAMPLSQAFVASLLQPRDAFAHKGTFGHGLLLAGNIGKMGAAVLAAKACLRTGVGLVTVNILPETFVIVQTALPEAMCISRIIPFNFKTYAAIGIGPGLGTDEATSKWVHDILANATLPMVVDADALNCIAKQGVNNWLDIIPLNTIITPHPKEFDRLFGNHTNDAERWVTAIKVSVDYDFVTVLKGHHTLITYQGKAWYNTTGNAGMAKGGSGDVLTGMITAFLAQGYPVINAALMGVYLHGLAGNITLETQAIESMLPSDLIENIGKAFITIKNII